ncbi:MAG: hypothetical protein P4M11_10855 [Candidatus Pacebacteria bacterium]|nr:hypothetical protein [Candidatus Paceibacterota bacterium]
MCAESATLFVPDDAMRKLSAMSAGGDSFTSSGKDSHGTAGPSILSARPCRDARSHSINSVKFRDSVEGQVLADVRLVESYKQYNILPDDPKDCACALL